MEKTVAKAFRLLEALAAHDRPQRVTELSRELGMVKSNTYRLLRTLVALGYVRQDADGLYEVSLRVWEVGTRALSHLTVQRVAGDHLKRLAASTGEQVDLAILDAVEVLFLTTFESVHASRARPVLGRRAPAAGSGTGKAMLAHQPDAVVRAAIRHFQTVMPRTAMTWERLKAELAEVRRSGWASNLGGWRPGVHGMAAPIAAPDNTIVAAVGLAAPAERLDAKRMRSLAPEIIETAQAVAIDLAYATTRADRAPDAVQRPVADRLAALS